MVDATKVSKIKIDTGYAGVREYSFLVRRVQKAKMFMTHGVLLYMVEMGLGNQQLRELLALILMVLNSLIKMVILLVVTVQMCMYLMRHMSLRIFVYMIKIVSVRLFY